MNGELTELFQAIKHWSREIHDQRHRENLDKFDKLFAIMQEFIALKTDVKWLTWGIRGIYAIIIIALVRLLGQ